MPADGRCMASRALGLLALLSIGMTNGAPQEDATPVITLVGPWTHGKAGKGSYTGRAGTVLHLDWHPSGSPGSVIVADDGTFTVDPVPSTASSVIVSDTTGGAAPATTTCGP